MTSSLLTTAFLFSLALGQQSDSPRGDKAGKGGAPSAPKNDPAKDVKPSAGSEATEFKAEDVAAITKAEGRSVTVKGKIYSVFQPKSGKLAILNFGGNHNACFKAVIESKDFAKFGGPEEILKTFEGKRATVVGKIKLYRSKPEIFIDEPKQITVE